MWKLSIIDLLHTLWFKNMGFAFGRWLTSRTVVQPWMKWQTPSSSLTQATLGLAQAPRWLTANAKWKASGKEHSGALNHRLAHFVCNSKCRLDRYLPFDP